MVFNVRIASTRCFLTLMSAKSDRQNIIYDGCGIFFFHDVIIYIQYHFLCISHSLSYFLYTDRRYLVTEVRAVVVPEDIPSFFTPLFCSFPE